MTYIKPPASHECTWRSGPPPEVGWWPASINRMTDCLRWWDGASFSDPAWAEDGKREAGRSAKRRSLHIDIQWTDRWWLK